MTNPNDEPIRKVKHPCRLDNLFRIIIECKRFRIPIRLAVKEKDFDTLPKSIGKYFDAQRSRKNG